MTLVNKFDNKIQYPNSIVDEEWEYLDPTPDIHVLFLQFDDRFFDGKLKSVELKWSPRMTVCAGLCRYEGRRSGHCSISLSVPLLKLRPRKDLVETLLHEMIHAFLFLTSNNRDRDGHGPEFQFHMNRINHESGTKITIYHSFHDEVKLYKQHWWKCNGPCQHKPPFYGLVKRSMNRAPGPNDMWWASHKATCGGSYVKIKEPEDYGVKKKKGENENKVGPGSKKQKIEALPGARDIRGFLSSPVAGSSKITAPSGTPSSPLKRIQPLLKPKSPPVKEAAANKNVAMKTPSKEKNISGYFNSSNPSVKGKAVAGFVGATKNKGSSTITVKAPSGSSPETTSPNKARPTQGGVVSRPTPVTSFVPFSGQGRLLGGGPSTKTPWSTSTQQSTSKIQSLPTSSIIKKETPKIVEIVSLDDSRDEKPTETFVPCPVCQMSLPISQVNAHLDSCLL